MTHLAHSRSKFLHCQNRTVSTHQCSDRGVDFVAWYPDGKCLGNGCTQANERAGRYISLSLRLAWWSSSCWRIVTHGRQSQAQTPTPDLGTLRLSVARSSCQRYRAQATGSFLCTYPLSIWIVKSLKLNDIWMSNNAHNLQLTVLSAWISDAKANGKPPPHISHLETLIL